MNAERRPQRGQITRPHEAPSLERTSVVTEVKKDIKHLFPRSKLLDAPEAHTQRPAQPSGVPLKEGPISSGDAFNYLSSLVKEGAIPAEVGMQIMGKSEKERDAIIRQIQTEAKREEASLREAGVYDEMKRLGEVQKGLVTEVTPLEPYNEKTWGWRAGEDLHRTKALTKDRLRANTAADIFVVNHQDGTETRYVDRASTLRYKLTGAVPKAGVYKETWGVKDRFGKRKLIERERVGEHIIQTGWKISELNGKPEEVYGITSPKYHELLREQFDIQAQIVEKQKDRVFAQINFGDTEYSPSEELKKSKKSVGDSVTRLLWYAKDTPKDKAVFAARNFASSAAFYFVFQNILPGLEPLAKAGIGAAYGAGGQFTLFNWGDLVKYGKEHPFISASIVLTPALLFLSPYLWIASQLGIQAVTQRENIKEVGIRIARARKFKKDHPELTNRKQRKAAFMQEYQESLRDRIFDKFADQHKEWFDQLKQLNPNVSEQLLKQAITLKALSYNGGIEELKKITRNLANDLMLMMGPRFLLLAGVPALNMALAATGLPLSPLVGHAVTAAVSSLFATGTQMYITEKTMAKTKATIAESFPELIPENQRRERRLAKQSAVK